MSDTACTVTFQGEQGGTYYVSCDQVKNINDKDLTNVSTGNILLYRDKGSNHFTITLEPSMHAYYYYSNGYHTETRYITNATNIKFNTFSNIYRNIDYVYLFVAFMVCVYCLFKLLRGFSR